MKNFKKLLVLSLAVVMCLTAFAISSSAAGALNAEVKLYARYNETGDKVIVTVATTENCGAIMATLTHPVGSAVEIKLADSKFIEKADATEAEKKEYYIESSSAVKFALVTNDTTNGSKAWADFYFDINTDSIVDGNKDSLKFNLVDVQVCDTGAENLGYYDKKNASIEIPYKALRCLGTKKDATENSLLFGSRVDLAGGGSGNDYTAATQITVDGVVYRARECGYSYAYTNRVESNFDNLGAKFKDNTGDSRELAPKDSSTTLVKRCTKYKYWNSEAGYFVYTLSIKGLAADRSVSMRPYVLYESTEGNEFVLIEGNVISRSCNEVAAAPAFIGVDGNVLW